MPSCSGYKGEKEGDQHDLGSDVTEDRGRGQSRRWALHVGSWRADNGVGLGHDSKGLMEHSDGQKQPKTSVMVLF